MPRKLGLASATAVVIGTAIGSGIFRSPAGIAQQVPHAATMLAVWAAGGAISLCGALTFAELAAALPETGGYYVYLREGWGRPAAFVFGWSQLVLLRASALGGIAIAFGDYALRTSGVDPVTHGLGSRAAAVAALAFAASVNIVGIRLGSVIVNISTAAKFGALVVLAACAFALGAAHGATPAHFTAPPAGALSAGSFGLALVGVLWAYDGFADVSYVAGEVKDPQRSLPRSILLGTIAIIVIYLTVNAAYIYVQPVATVARSPLVAADTMTTLFGPPGAALVSLFVAISTFGALNAVTLASPRIFFAMADDRLFFPGIARIHPRFGTPYVAILLTSGLGIALVLSRSFEALTNTFVIAIWPFYALCAGAVYRLRARRPDLPRPYRVVGYPIVPAVFIAAIVWFLLNALITAPVSTAITFAIILAGLPLYFFIF